MEYRRFGSKIFLRIDRGEEILQQLKAAALAERIQLAHISALGAVDDFSVGVFRPKEGKYEANEFSGDHEIVSLTGTITTMDGAFYAHLHMSAGDGTGKVVGGHLTRAIVSATCEMVIDVVDGRVERRFDQETGLNLFRFLDE